MLSYNKELKIKNNSVIWVLFKYFDFLGKDVAVAYGQVEPN